MPTGLEATAGLAVLVATGILADAIRPNGRVRSAIDAALHKRQTATEAHQAISSVVDKLDHIDAKVDEGFERVESKTDRNAFLIKQFHGEESVNVPVDDVLDDDTDFLRKPDDGE